MVIIIKIFITLAFVDMYFTLCRFFDILNDAEDEQY